MSTALAPPIIDEVTAHVATYSCGRPFAFLISCVFCGTKMIYQLMGNWSRAEVTRLASCATLDLCDMISAVLTNCCADKCRRYVHVVLLTSLTSSSTGCSPCWVIWGAGLGEHALSTDREQVISFLLLSNSGFVHFVD